MKNYFKRYYKTRITKGVLGESTDFQQKLISEALVKHDNIMNGFKPNGRDAGFIDPSDRADYIKHFTNFMNENYFEDVTVSWSKAKDVHNLIVNEQDAKYLSNFADFMNSPTTCIIIENAMLSEEEKKTTFQDDVAAAVRQHVKDHDTTVMSSRGDNFTRMDIAHHAANMIASYLKNSGERKPHEELHFQKQLRSLRNILPEEHVKALLKKHFPQHK
jgi:hypothetical protein